MPPIDPNRLVEPDRVHRSVYTDPQIFDPRLNVLQAINNQYFTQGILNGFAIVGIAIIFDRISQAYGRRLQQHRSTTHD